MSESEPTAPAAQEPAAAPAAAPPPPPRRPRRERDEDDIGDGFRFAPVDAGSLAGGVRPSRKLMERQATVDFLNATEEYEGILNDLDFETGARTKISVHRVSPTEDPETGVPLEGHCKTWENTRVSQEMIAEEFGGGTYKAMIYGPKPGHNPPWGLITTKPIKIPGYPIVPTPKRRAGQRAAGGQNGSGGGSDVNGILDRLMSAKKDDVDTIINALSQRGDGGVSQLIPVLTKALDPGRSQVDLEAERVRREQDRKDEKEERDAERARLKEERAEERKRDREEREEERQRLKEERADELAKAKEEAKHEREMQTMRFEAEKAAQAAATQVAIAQANANAQLQIKALEAQAAQSQANAQLQIEAMKQQALSERTFALELNKTTQGMQEKMLTVTTEAAKSQTEFLGKQLDKAMSQSSKDPKKDLMETFEFYDRMQGRHEGESDEPVVLRAIEKGFEGISKVAPGIFAAAGVGGSARRVAKQQQANEGPAEVEEGSIAVVEDAGARRRKLQKRQAARAQAQAQQGKVTEVKAQVINDKRPPDQRIVDAATAGDEPAALTPNDLVDFVFPSLPPYAEFDNDVLELLIKNIDLAITKQMQPKEILEKIVKRFPAAVVDYLKAIPVDMIIGQLDSMPNLQGWTVMSLSGQEKLRRIHELL